MNDAAVKALMTLKGVGAASARRLVEAGLDDFAKLAASGEDVLQTIKGLNRSSIPAILSEARGKATEDVPQAPEVAKAKTMRLARVHELIDQLQREVTALVATAGEGKDPGDDARIATLQKEAAKLAKVLGKLEAALPARLKRTGKALTKADRKLTALEGRGPKKTASGLKKTRRSLKKALD